KVFTSKATKELIIKGQLFGKTKAQLNDINGREVLSVMLDSSTNYNILDTRSFQSGVYILQVSDDTHNYTQKVLIN
ncbi:T9SS type A sorting domain-containing protein, partial [Winogradskyella sp.]|uniref:T9SS type A sorting domain-containing protein n=1 Tax=Winogradskyella sp. TaxID=1883156 RepID=UPI0025EC6A8A